MTLRRLESAVLIVVGTVLLVAVVVGATRRGEAREHFGADARVLERYVRAETHRPVNRPRFVRVAGHDTACATAGAGGPVRLCLELAHREHGVRALGGWRMPVAPARPGPRFQCFGAAARAGLCPTASPRSARPRAT